MKDLKEESKRGDEKKRIILERKAPVSEREQQRDGQEWEYDPNKYVNI